MELWIALVLFLLNNHVQESVGIMGGDAADPGEFPFSVSVQSCLGPCSHECGGVIISPSWILTSATCAQYSTDLRYRIVAGSLNIDQINSNAQKRDVTITVIHPHFSHYSEVSANDISLLKLNSSLSFDNMVQPVAILAEQFEIQGEAMLSGWGERFREAPDPDVLQKIKFDIISTEECVSSLNGSLETYLDFNDTVEFCTGPLKENYTSCRKDSGDALTQTNVLVGIASYVHWCCECGPMPTVYTKVNQFLTWIQSNVDEDIIIYNSSIPTSTDISTTTYIPSTTSSPTSTPTSASADISISNKMFIFVIMYIAVYFT